MGCVHLSGNGNVGWLGLEKQHIETTNLLNSSKSWKYGKHPKPKQNSGGYHKIEQTEHRCVKANVKIFVYLSLFSSMPEQSI